MGIFTLNTTTLNQMHTKEDVTNWVDKLSQSKEKLSRAPEGIQELYTAIPEILRRIAVQGFLQTMRDINYFSERGIKMTGMPQGTTAILVGSAPDRYMQLEALNDRCQPLYSLLNRVVKPKIIEPKYILMISENGHVVFAQNKLEHGVYMLTDLWEGDGDIDMALQAGWV